MSVPADLGQVLSGGGAELQRPQLLVGRFGFQWGESIQTLEAVRSWLSTGEKKCLLFSPADREVHCDKVATLSWPPKEAYACVTCPISFPKQLF